jgi:hypothetical protein
MSSGRFVSLTEDELREITNGKDAKSNKNWTKYAANTFRNYLRNKNLPEDFENWSKADLDSRLRCFYAEVRSASGELYKQTSLFSIRNGINRHLSKTSSINITKNAEIDASNDMFLSV